MGLSSVEVVGEERRRDTLAGPDRLLLAAVPCTLLLTHLAPSSAAWAILLAGALSLLPLGGLLEDAAAALDPRRAGRLAPLIAPLPRLLPLAVLTGTALAQGQDPLARQLLLGGLLAVLLFEPGWTLLRRPALLPLPGPARPAPPSPVGLEALPLLPFALLLLLLPALSQVVAGGEAGGWLAGGLPALCAVLLLGGGALTCLLSPAPPRPTGPDPGVRRAQRPRGLHPRGPLAAVLGALSVALLALLAPGLTAAAATLTPGPLPGSSGLLLGLVAGLGGVRWSSRGLGASARRAGQGATALQEEEFAEGAVARAREQATSWLLAGLPLLFALASLPGLGRGSAETGGPQRLVPDGLQGLALAVAGAALLVAGAPAVPRDRRTGALLLLVLAPLLLLLAAAGAWTGVLR